MKEALCVRGGRLRDRRFDSAGDGAAVAGLVRGMCVYELLDGLTPASKEGITSDQCAVDQRATTCDRLFNSAGPLRADGRGGVSMVPLRLARVSLLQDTLPVLLAGRVVGPVGPKPDGDHTISAVSGVRD